MKVLVPEFCLIAVVGAPSISSNFLKRNFLVTEVIDWADSMRSPLVLDLEQRLRARQLTVIDASELSRKERAGIAKTAKTFHTQSVAIVLCAQETSELQTTQLEQDGFRDIHTVPSDDRLASVQVERQPMLVDRRHEQGPFDIIGDVHGCADELSALLGRLGYDVQLEGTGEDRIARCGARHGRRAVFVGDLVDRGPNSPDVLRIAMGMVEGGYAFVVPGNHDAKFLRWMNGRKVRVAHGLEKTISQFEHEPERFRQKIKLFLDGLVSHAWLEGGNLAVAHAGIKEDMMGRSSGAVRQFCLYGETSGETDQFGLPVRYNWAAAYRGETTIVYGHTPVPEAEWLNNTLCVDTGCVFGGKLTALRWPEKEIVSVKALRTYVEPVRPLGHPPPPPPDAA